ncbi:DUF2573 family protein [Paenibacillus sp. NPDC056579]|uniref:DUF2573 family protein n=1 Tax=unclassified Paenibacillus TaxID=185978 RepID=UPI001EF86BFB|nr:DUF2573 family protein [Paenibacillus sp. H1-7]ULL18049.1 DUF2573 family protein [Paenibacillus sp. H1-7]
MNPQVQSEFEALVEKFTELLTGHSSPEMVEKIKMWSVYSHIHRSMPALTSHWNQAHPEGKAAIRELFEEVRSLNLELKERNKSTEQE